MTGVALEAGPVVAGVDGSVQSMRAAEVAADAARRRHRPLLLVHATPWVAADGDRPDVALLLREGALALLDRVATAVRDRAAVEVGTLVVDGPPVHVLRGLSADAALLVLGSRGLGGLPGLLVGSTAAGVVHGAACPVVVLPSRPDAGDEDVVPGLRAEDGTAAAGPVVAGVEGRAGDDDVLAFAVGEAALRGTGVRAVHAWRDVALDASAGRIPALVDGSTAEAAERRLLAESVAGWREKEPDVPIAELVVRDRAPLALLDAARDAGLLVVGHRHRSVLGRIGATTHALLHRAPCPLAVVPLVEEPS